jgi:DNA-binding NarL/FixJ family response regulator
MFRILGEKMPLGRICPAIILIVAFVSVRSLLPMNIFGYLLVSLMALSLLLFGRLDLYRSIFSAVITFFVSYLGNLLIESVLLVAYPGLASFFFGSTLGELTGAAIELFFPILAFLVFPRLSLRLPLKEKGEPYDFLDIVVPFTLGSMYYVINYAYVKVYMGFIHQSKTLASDLKLLFIASFGIGGGVIIILKAMKKRYDLLKKHHAEQLEFEQQQRELERQRYETELRLTQEKIDGLNNQIAELEKLNETLQAIKTTPQKILDDLTGAINNAYGTAGRLEEYKKALLSQMEPGRVFDNVFITGVAFTEIEIKIIELIIEGKTNQEIGREVHLSPGTVKNIITDILSKTGARDRTVLAVQYALKKYKNKDE